MTRSRRVPGLFQMYYPYRWPGTHFFRRTYPGRASNRVPGQRTELFADTNAGLHTDKSGEQIPRNHPHELVWLLVAMRRRYSCVWCPFFSLFPEIILVKRFPVMQYIVLLKRIILYLVCTYSTIRNSNVTSRRYILSTGRTYSNDPLYIVPACAINRQQYRHYCGNRCYSANCHTD